MTVYISGMSMVTTHGDLEQTWSALKEGRSGVSTLHHFAPTDRLGVEHGYPILDSDTPSRIGDAGRWLAGVVADAIAQTDISEHTRITVVVGTGLRELRSLEIAHREGSQLKAEDLHFRRRVQDMLPQIDDVITISNACSASGTAVAVGMDLLETGEADAVIVAGCDTMTESMLAVIGRVAVKPSCQVQPFQSNRRGVLLGDGAAAVVLSTCPEGSRAVVRSVGMSCDAFHETAPDEEGIVAAMRDAHDRAGTDPRDLRLLVAHGTGTELNDPVEATALTKVVGAGVPVTAIKGAIGHTSGGASLMSTIVAVLAMERGVVPPVVGLSDPIPETASLDLIIGKERSLDRGVAQIDAFGFGGVNAVTLVEV